jgi:hypothetical protein
MFRGAKFSTVDKPNARVDDSLVVAWFAMSFLLAVFKHLRISHILFPRPFYMFCSISFQFLIFSSCSFSFVLRVDSVALRRRKGPKPIRSPAPVSNLAEVTFTDDFQRGDKQINIEHRVFLFLEIEKILRPVLTCEHVAVGLLKHQLFFGALLNGQDPWSSARFP